MTAQINNIVQTNRNTKETQAQQYKWKSKAKRKQEIAQIWSEWRVEMHGKKCEKTNSLLATGRPTDKYNVRQTVTQSHTHTLAHTHTCIVTFWNCLYIHGQASVWGNVAHTLRSQRGKQFSFFFLFCLQQQQSVKATHIFVGVDGRCFCESNFH